MTENPSITLSINHHTRSAFLVLLQENVKPISMINGDDKNSKAFQTSLEGFADDPEA